MKRQKEHESKLEKTLKDVKNSVNKLQAADKKFQREMRDDFNSLADYIRNDVNTKQQHKGLKPQYEKLRKVNFFRIVFLL